MPEFKYSNIIQSEKGKRTVFILSVVVLVFFNLLVLAGRLGIQNTFLGVLTELLTLPMLALLLALMVIAVFQWIDLRFHLKSLPFLSLLMQVAVIVLLVISA